MQSLHSNGIDLWNSSLHAFSSSISQLVLIVSLSSAKKYDLKKWKYAELRDTINTSCEIELGDRRRKRRGNKGDERKKRRECYDRRWRIDGG